MSSTQLASVAERERRDLWAKVRFALVSIVLLPPVGATLTSLGVSRPTAAVVVFAVLALLLLAFVVARGSEDVHITPEGYERDKVQKALLVVYKLSERQKIAWLSVPPVADQVAARPAPIRGRLLLRLVSRLAYLFSSRPRIAT